MKTVLSTLGVCLFFLLSCKKDQERPTSNANPAAWKYAVSFNISDFAPSTETMGKKGATVSARNNGDFTSALEDHIKSLLYIAYDAEGNEAGRIRQYIPNSQGLSSSYQYVYPIVDDFFVYYTKPFGTIVDTLTSGNYTVILFGSTNVEFTINDRHYTDPTYGDRNPLEEAYAGEDNGLVNRISRTGDTFVKKLTLVVGNESIQQDVTLERITGKIEINILDPIPANADKFEFRFIGAASYFSFASGLPSGNTAYDDSEDLVNADPVEISDAEKGTANYQFSKFIFAREQPIKVEIRCFDSSGNIIARKMVNDVHVYKNKRTILKGKLFDSPATVGFNVAVNDTWDSDTTEVTF